jgi:hypothetical protein
MTTYSNHSMRRFGENAGIYQENPSSNNKGINKPHPFGLTANPLQKLLEA